MTAPLYCADNGRPALDPTLMFKALFISAVTYPSLGFGDHVPLLHVRLIAGVEVLNGLLLIGWSASFTYLAMERYVRCRSPDTGGREPDRRFRSEQPRPHRSQDMAERSIATPPFRSD
jgi:hypothetical protein